MPSAPSRFKPLAIVCLGVAVAIGVVGWNLRSRIDSGGAGVTTDGGLRENFLKQGMASCVSGAHASLAKQNLVIADEKIDAYCACSMAKVNDAFTNQDLYTIAGAATHGVDMPAELRSRMGDAVKACAPKML